MTKVVSDLADIVHPSIDHQVGGPFRLLREYLTFYWDEKAKGSSFSFGPLIFFSTVSGLGKRLASIIVARELGLRYWEVLPHEVVSAQKRDDLAAILQNADQYLLYFNCGRYAFSPQGEDLIYQVITHNKAYLYDHPFDDSLELDPFPEVVVIVGTERPELVEWLRSRIRVIQFPPYSEAELRKIYTDKLQMARWTIEEEALAEVVGRSGGNAGIGIRHLETAYMLSRNLGRPAINIAHVQKAHQLLRQNDFSPLTPRP